MNFQRVVYTLFLVASLGVFVGGLHWGSQAVGCEVTLPSGQSYRVLDVCQRPREVIFTDEKVCKSCCLVRYPGFLQGANPVDTDPLVLWQDADTGRCFWRQGSETREIVRHPLVRRLYRHHLEETWDQTQYMTLPKVEKPADWFER
jgi:hypothetical protein